MVRAPLALASLWLGACFTEPAAGSCSPGSEGCACLELQCESGLVCADAVCVSNDDVGATESSGDAGGQTTSGSSGQVSADSTGQSTDDDGGPTSGDVDTGGSSDTGGASKTCGNGVLEDEEMCDQGPGCTDCILDNYVCNPINNVGCPLGTKCSDTDERYTLACLPFSENPPLQLGESSCFDFEPLDQACELGLSCTPFQSTNTCDGGACCTKFCDLLDP
ncbi:MAG: hypothetical protein AAF721_11810, partial [Myxococcota bacterium]